MNTGTLSDFLATSVDGAFEFVRHLSKIGQSPGSKFLLELNRTLSGLELGAAREGTPEWAHLVAGLMIAHDWDPDSFARVAASFISHEDGAVWTAAFRVLSEVSQLDQETFDAIVSSVPKSALARVAPDSGDALLAKLRVRVVPTSA